jgi:anti-anti-sigma factor
VVLDLRELAFMDCSGAHAIVYASISARQLGRRLILLRGPPDVDRVFTLTGSTGAVESADLDPAELRVQALPRLAAADRAP